GARVAVFPPCAAAAVRLLKNAKVGDTCALEVDGDSDARKARADDKDGAPTAFHAAFSDAPWPEHQDTYPSGLMTRVGDVAAGVTDTKGMPGAVCARASP